MSGNKTVALIGCTGKVGGWVLEMALERKHQVRALVRKPEKLDAFKDRIEIVQGGIKDEDKMRELVTGANVVISTLGSPSNSVLVMKIAAETLVKVLSEMDNPPRVIWMTSIGVNDAIKQGHRYGCKENCLPSCWLCCGYGCFGCLVFNMLVPCLIGQNLWNDMGHSEDVINGDEKIKALTTIVRPTNMHPAGGHEAFTEEWKKEGGDNIEYLTKVADENPPNMWVNRRTIANFLLDCVDEEVIGTKFEGSAISLFQGKSTEPITNQVKPI